MDNNIIQNIIDSFSSPVFVFDENELIDRTNAILEILGDISLCFSIKANPFLIPSLLPIVRYFEVCSPGELAICQQLNVPGDKIIYSGVHKELSDITEAVRYDVAYLTAESLRQYDLICQAAGEENRIVKVILRLTSKNQFGMSEKDMEIILGSLCSNVLVEGIHYFAGTGRKSLKKHQEELAMLSDLLNRLRNKSGLKLPMLEYGPGLPFPYFTDEDYSDTLKPLKDLIHDLINISGHCTLSVEMGRFLASSCGCYITKICDIKTSNDTKWCIIDGGINHINYLGQMMGMRIPVIRHYKKGILIDDISGEMCTICGSLCTVNDILVRSMPVSDPEIGDILIFTNIGAYSVTEAPGLFLSRTLPRIIMRRDNDTQMIRDFRESWKINIKDDL